MRVSLWLLAAVLCWSCSGREQVDLLVHNARVITVADKPSASAFAVRGGRVAAVGGEELLSRFTAAETLDLGGRTVTPGFNDSHTHIRGRANRFVDLSGLASLADLQQRVREKATELGPGEWITGYGWSEDELAEGRKPLRGDLDEAAPANPVVLTRAGGHSAVANSRALALARITRDTPDPDRGVIERDARGEPTGVIRERQDLVTRLVPDAPPSELRESFITSLKDQFRFGITSLIHASATPDDYALWQSVYAEHGAELPRAAVQILWPDRDKLSELPYKTGAGDERLRVGAVKIFADGGFTGPAAYTIDPYKGQPNYRGKLNMTEGELRDAIFAAHELGWQLGIHAIGDRAIQLVVDDLVAALEAMPREDHRHYLNHFTVMPPPATMDRMAAYDIAITQQPNFTYTLEGRYAANLDGDRLERNNPLRTPIEHGVFLALSSDILPIDPRLGLFAAVTRQGMSGRVYGSDERLTVEEAIRAYTLHGAWLTREEDEKGSIEPGKLADFVALREDPLNVPSSALKDLTIERTYLGGRLVFQAQRE